jgi:hypothetical protein
MPIGIGRGRGGRGGSVGLWIGGGGFADDEEEMVVGLREDPEPWAGSATAFTHFCLST